MRKYTLPAIIVVVAVLIVGGAIYVKKGIGPTATLTPTSDEGVPVGVSKIHPECQLGGELVFIEEDLYRVDGAYFNYQKVEDPHDFVRWSISPQEEASIGPNMFSSLTLPSGKETITFAFAKAGRPQHKTYELKASIDYPFVVNNKVEILNKPCEGVTKVRIAY